MDILEQSYREMEDYFLETLRFSTRPETPRLIFVFASPGAGKSTNIKPRLNKMFAENKVVNLEIDELKTFIPKGCDVAKTANEWFLRLVDKSVADKRNIMIFRQRSMLKPQQTWYIYQKAKEAGYITQAVFLALDKERSRLGLIHRYEFAIENALGKPEDNRASYPRRPDFLSHYIFYKAMPIFLQRCKVSPDVDIIDVYDRRGKHLAWSNKLTGEHSTEGVEHALLRERTRQWDGVEKDTFNRRCSEAQEKMKAHGRSWFDYLKFRILTYTRKSK